MFSQQTGQLNGECQARCQKYNEARPDWQILKFAKLFQNFFNCARSASSLLLSCRGAGVGARVCDRGTQAPSSPGSPGRRMARWQRPKTMFDQPLPEFFEALNSKAEDTICKLQLNGIGIEYTPTQMRLFKNKNVAVVSRRSASIAWYCETKSHVHHRTPTIVNKSEDLLGMAKLQNHSRIFTRRRAAACAASASLSFTQ